MGGTKEKERKEEGKERRGDEENRVEGAAAQPLASTAHGENRAEGHDPRPPAPTPYAGGAVAPLAGPILLGAVQPIPGPSVAPVEPSTAAVSDLGSEERKPRFVKRSGSRSSEGKKGAEKGKERTGSGTRSRSNSRKRIGEDDGKESRERRRETGAGSRGSSRYRSGEYDTADEVAADVLGSSDETISEASQPSMEPEGGLSAASAPPKLAMKVVRGRGRPPTTGEHVGLAATRREVREAELKLLLQEAEREVPQTGISCLRKRRRERRASREEDPVVSPLGPMGPEDASRRSVEDLGRGIAIATGTIDMVASKSSNLKGTYARELKEAVMETREVFREVVRRLQTTGDVTGLRAENAALHAQVEQLGG